MNPDLRPLEKHRPAPFGWPPGLPGVPLDRPKPAPEPPGPAPETPPTLDSLPHLAERYQKSPYEIAELLRKDGVKPVVILDGLSYFGTNEVALAMCDRGIFPAMLYMRCEAVQVITPESQRATK